MKSLRSRLILILLALGLIPLGLSLMINGIFTEASLLRSKHTEMRNFGNEIKRQISHSMTTIQSSLNSIATNPFLTNPTTPIDVVEKELLRLAENTPHCRRLSLLSPNGFVEAATDDKDVREREREAMQVAAANDILVSRPQLNPQQQQDPSNQEVMLKFFYPVRDAAGKLYRILKADVALTAIADILRSAKFGENGAFVLLDDLSNVLYHRDSKLLLTRYNKLIATDFINGPNSGEYSYQGKSLIYDCISIPKSETLTSFGWTLLTTMDQKEAMALARQTRWTAMGIASIFLSITALAGFWIASSIAKPVVAASQAARAVAAGNMKMRLEDKGADELKELAAAFNQMTCQVLQHQEELGLLVDSRTRKYLESQQSLAQTTAQLHAANEATKEGMFVVNRSGEVITANRQMEEIFGLTSQQLRHRPLVDIRNELSVRFQLAGDFSLAWEQAMSNPSITSEKEWELSTPTQKTLSIYTAPVFDENHEMIARLWMFRDITAQRLLEDSLRQAQKMEAVGRLAGGVAHDFNNLLQGILGNLFIVQQDPVLRGHEDMRRCVHSARSAGLRAAQLVKGLLGFSRQTHLTLGRCDVNDVVMATQTLVRPTFDPRINIGLDLQEGVWGLNADSNQIEQVIMNMIMNAKDAMPNGGSLMLTTRNVFIAEDCLEVIPGSHPGEHVRISITDEGTGMSEEVRSKIFEPFFTTKEQGKGTGLGLATSFGIVQQHGGWINCDSLEGHGTTFHIFLPRNEVAAAANVATEPPKPVGGKETILVVDDELVVRAVAEAILKKYGYTILTACDGEEALDMLARHDGSVDLVLMDMTMPRLSGMDTFRHMRKGLAPNVPVVICSGYLVDLSGFMAEAGCVPNGFMQKPYDIDEMSRTVRRVLDETAASKPR